MTKISNRMKGLTVTRKTREVVISFLKNLFVRKFSEAERTLKTLRKGKFANQEYKNGYVNALEGMLLSSRSGDERDFFNKINISKEDLKKLKDEFNDFTNIETRNSFDAGYFSAWSDFIEYLSYQEKQIKFSK